MILPDVNVLIYAFRADAPKHETCKPWLDALVADDAHFGLSPVALSAVVRITTNQRAFRVPSTLEEAFGFCENLLSRPNCEIIEPGDQHWAIFRKLCIESSTRGARTTDAWFAALAVEHACTWVTFDRDYARFSGLKWQEPA